MSEVEDLKEFVKSKNVKTLQNLSKVKLEAVEDYMSFISRRGDSFKQVYQLINELERNF